MRKRTAAIAVSLCSILGGPALADISIAAAGPMSGPFATLGAQLTAGVSQAVFDLNAAGGILGQQLSLEIGDDVCDPKRAVAVANQMAGRGVALVVGHLCSGSSIPASEVYAEEKIIQISAASTHPKLTDERPGPGVLRLFGRDDQQGRVAGNFLAREFAHQNIAIIHDSSAYGKTLADETRKAMNLAGKTAALYESYVEGQEDYFELVSNLKASKIDALFIGGFHTAAGLIVKQMRQQGMDTVLVAGDALIDYRFWSIAGDAGEGTLMTFTPDPRKNDEAADIVANFAASGIEPEGFVLYAYAAVQAWAQAAQAAGSTEFDAVASALASGRFNTVIGDFSFDQIGDVTLSGFVFYKWSQGSYDYL